MIHPISSYELETDRSIIFRDNNEAVYYLVANNHLNADKRCEICNGNMKFEKCRKHKIGIVYRCSNRNCRKIRCLLKNRLIEKPKINLNDHLYAVYKWIENGFEKDICRNIRFAKGTYQKIKKNINRFLAREFVSGEKLGVKI